MSLTPGHRLGPFEVVSLLGQGGMGEVYKARDTHLDRFVALKVLRSDLVANAERTRRFIQEAKAASALNHPNIVTIYDIARDGSADYIAMEYVDGRPLDQMISRGGMKLSELLHYAIPAADALAKAHASGIVHRDLKPSNIMVTGDRRVKILDFGLAKLAAAAPADSAETIQQDPVRTGEGWVVGTPAYMSPEQAEGKPVDARSDIFSFGAVLYEIATGVSPFRGESAASTLAAVLTSTPNPPSQTAPQIPRELDRLIARCLRKDPGRRFQSMADLALELEDIKTESGERIEVARAAKRGPAAARGRSSWLIASAVAGVLLAAAGAWWWPGSSAPVAPPTIVSLTTYHGREGSPSLSPDGTQVAFVWRGESQNNADIYLKPVDAVTPLRLTSDPLDDTKPSWSPSGRALAFARVQGNGRAAIYVTPPIPGSERKVGDVRRAGAGTAGDLHFAASWTPDGKWLVVADAGLADGENGIFLIPVESGDRRSIVTSPIATQRYAIPVVAPSGRHLAFAGCQRQAPACDLWVQPLGADFTRDGDPKKLTNFAGAFSGLAWAPDGRSVMAGVTTSQGSLSYLWRVPISGGEPVRLDWAGPSAYSPSISQASRRLVVERDSSTVDIWRFEETSSSWTSGTHALSSTFPDVDPEFSPDGSRIAFASARSGQDQEIWIGRSDGSGVTQLTRGANGRNRGSPRWSHDGKRIAFDSASEDGVRRAFIIDATGGEPRSIGDIHVNYPSWSPDDRWIYFGSNRSGRTEVWRVPSEGGPPEQVTREGGTGPRVSADGRTLYYRRLTTLLARPLAGGEDRVIVEKVAGSPSAYLPVGNEVFHVVAPDPLRPLLLELRAIDVTTSKIRSISRFEAVAASGLTVAPDGKTIVLSVFNAASDLMLVENFQ
jgi:Tol biopolymer transport system component/tRNA A-37 threonylcarbamoyl transferase component Bud32